MTDEASDRPSRRLQDDGASVAPGYVVADLTTASAHKDPPWLCAFVQHRTC